MSNFDVDIEIDGKPYTVSIEAENEQMAGQLLTQAFSNRDSMNHLRQMVRSGKTPDESILSSINRTALGIGQVGLEALSLPIELAGETLRTAVEQKPGDFFRAPSIIQRGFPSTRTEEPPSMGFDVVNKLLRAGPAAIAALPEGPKASFEAALRAYQAERGITGTVEDTALALMSGRLPLPGAGTTVAEAPFRAVGEAVKSGVRGAKATGQTAIRAGLGPTKEQQNIYLRRPNEVRSAKNFDELADDFAENLNQLASKVDELDDAAWDTLLKLKAEPRSKIINALKSAKREFSGKTKISDSDRKAVAQIDKYIERVDQIKQKGVKKGLEHMLDQPQLKEIVQSIRRDARFDLPETDPVNRAVLKAQNKIDMMLKENSNYKEVMEQLAPATKTLKEAASKFRPKRVPGVGFVATDTTAQKLSTAARGLEKKPETRRLLENVSKQTGRDFIDDLKLTSTKASFDPADRARGSARTVLGALSGLALEPLIPGQGLATLAGGAAGRVADVYGGVAARGILDAARSLSNFQAPQVPTITPLANVLRNILSARNIPPLAVLGREQ